MSQIEQDNDTQTLAAGLLPLLKEYKVKLARIGNKAHQEQEQFRKRKRSILPNKYSAESRDVKVFDELRFVFHRLLTPINDLIRQASQLVEHGKLETITRLELSLRLAELEAEMERTQRRIDNGFLE